MLLCKAPLFSQAVHFTTQTGYLEEGKTNVLTDYDKHCLTFVLTEYALTQRHESGIMRLRKEARTTNHADFWVATSPGSPLHGFDPPSRFFSCLENTGCLPNRSSKKRGPSTKPCLSSEVPPSAWRCVRDSPWEPSSRGRYSHRSCRY